MDSLIAMGATAATVYGIFAIYRIGWGFRIGDMELVHQYSHDLYLSLIHICSYIKDVYLIRDRLMAQDDIHIMEIKDYIEQPKGNGYRSLDRKSAV